MKRPKVSKGPVEARLMGFDYRGGSAGQALFGSSTNQEAPADPEDFDCSVTAYIGPTSSADTDAFEMRYASARWMRSAWSPGRWENTGVVLQPNSPGSFADVRGAGWMYPFFVVDRWDLQLLTDVLLALCLSCSPGPSWGDVASRLARVLRWEESDNFDDWVNSGSEGPGFPPAR
jgi:hypothetical protein